MMDLRALRYFVSAVEEGSISAAAVKNHVAQPSITLAISKLEGEFSCQLLVRHRKGVNPTEKGMALYDMAVDLLNHANSIEQRLNPPVQPSKLKLFIEKSVQLSYLQTLSDYLKQQAIQVEIELVGSETEADICITSYLKKAQKDIFYPLASERYALLIPKQNELAYHAKIDLSDLNGQTIIERYHCENRPLFEKLLEHFNLELPVAARVDNEEWALSLVAIGLGLSFSPLPADYNDPRFVIRDIEELLDFEVPERQIGILLKHNSTADFQALHETLNHAFAPHN